MSVATPTREGHILTPELWVRSLGELESVEQQTELVA